MARRNRGSFSSPPSGNVNTPKPRLRSIPKQNATAAGALHLLGQLNIAEQEALLNQIITDPTAPFHNVLDMVITTCLHAMKAAVRAYVFHRDAHANGGRLWAADLLRQAKMRNGRSWGELYKRLPEDPEAVKALKLLSPDYRHGALSLADKEKVRKAIRDLERHANAKAQKAEEVYRLVLAALPPWVRESFPGVEPYLKLY
jgi:hypothetical protein